MLSKFDYLRPKTLEEALNYLSEKDGARILAGGTDIMVLLRRNIEGIKHIVDIKDIPETNRLEHVEGEGLFIGASINVNQVAEAEAVKSKYKALSEAANSLASYQLRNRATLVGNICNASPGADLAGPLLVFEALVEIAGPNGRRRVKINEFFTGVKKTVLQRDEIVLGVLLPEVQTGDKSKYLKQARLKGHDLATVGVAIRIDAANKPYIAMAAVAPTPIRLSKLEEELAAKGLSAEAALWAEKEVRSHIKPISDVRSSAEYRLHAAGVLLKQGLLELLKKEGN